MQAQRRSVQIPLANAASVDRPVVPDLWGLVNALHNVLRSCEGRLRIELLVHLLSQPRCVSDLTALCESSKPDVSKALSGLMTQQLVRFRQQVTRRFYEITENVSLAWHPEDVEVRMMSAGRPRVGVYIPKHLVLQLHPTLIEPKAIYSRVDIPRLVVVPLNCESDRPAIAGLNDAHGHALESTPAGKQPTHIPGRDAR